MTIEYLGQYVPLVMIPRFTTYVGQGEYVSAGLDVSEFYRFVVTVWRGPLVQGAGSGAALSIVFETSEDAQVWFGYSGISPIITANGNTVITAELLQRWLRVKVTLTEDATDHVVALTCWAIGHLDRRER